MSVYITKFNWLMSFREIITVILRIIKKPINTVCRKCRVTEC